MAKELPYFKFEPGQWDTGNIQLCTHEQKGIFIELCSLYWQRLGDLPYKLAVQKVCGGNATALESLCQAQIIHNEEGFLCIDFLNEQLQEFENIGKTNSKNAKDGWIKRKDATAMRPHSERNAIREEKRRGDKKEIAHDFEFKSSFAQIFNKPYPKERGLDGAGRDVDTILAQLSHIPKEEILKTAKAMRAVYQSQKLHLPTNVATLINSFTGTDWQERVKALDPEYVAENISKERKNGKQRTPEPDTIGTSAPGSLG